WLAAVPGVLPCDTARLDRPGGTFVLQLGTQVPKQTSAAHQKSRRDDRAMAQHGRAGNDHRDCAKSRGDGRAEVVPAWQVTNPCARNCGPAKTSAESALICGFSRKD